MVNKQAGVGSDTHSSYWGWELGRRNTHCRKSRVAQNVGHTSCDQMSAIDMYWTVDDTNRLIHVLTGL